MTQGTRKESKEEPQNAHGHPGSRSGGDASSPGRSPSSAQSPPSRPVARRPSCSLSSGAKDLQKTPASASGVQSRSTTLQEGGGELDSQTRPWPSSLEDSPADSASGSSEATGSALGTQRSRGEGARGEKQVHRRRRGAADTEGTEGFEEEEERTGDEPEPGGSQDAEKDRATDASEHSSEASQTDEEESEYLSDDDEPKGPPRIRCHRCAQVMEFDPGSRFVQCYRCAAINSVLCQVSDDGAHEGGKVVGVICPCCMTTNLATSDKVMVRCGLCSTLSVIPETKTPPTS
ncbi:hypothetical protein BESB_040750 [Besnoitia besnoiti]|uniref:Uncharacterized protein n=1 Tax=Besnoitia besnoiti TaxID=94643 RepID=A0A2A9MNU6_BESBE|nr:hypothetical protein BESB_040750 [Besnoitia besnoiti]PFH37617.1 hypothetical protein BESB_040750 [Besnoitia besnoiti]